MPLARVAVASTAPTPLGRRPFRACLNVATCFLAPHNRSSFSPNINHLIFLGSKVVSGVPVAIKFVRDHTSDFFDISLRALFFRNRESLTHLNCETSFDRIGHSMAHVRSVLKLAIHAILITSTFLAGVPQVHHFGQEGLHNVLVIDLLGPNLEDLFDMCGRKFTIKTVCMAAKQMVSARSVHSIRSSCIHSLNGAFSLRPVSSSANFAFRSLASKRFTTNP
jgi:hypothetical protein